MMFRVLSISRLPLVPLLLLLALGCVSPPTPTSTSVPTPTTQPTVTLAPPPPTPQPRPTDTAPPPTPTPGLATLEVPIEVQGAANLGSLQLELVYDPLEAELRDMRAGPLARNALVDFNRDTPGRVRIGVVDASGISGDGAIIILFFLPIGQAADIEMNLEAVEASDTDLKDLVVQSTVGLISRPGKPVTAPVLRFRR